MRRALMLRDIDKDLYQIPHEVLWTPPAGRSVYGGQIIGACTLAAHKTLDAVHSEFVLSSLHSYFLTGGDSKKNILVRVERLRDGASFCTRSVVAQQDGNAIFAAELQVCRYNATCYGTVQECFVTDCGTLFRDVCYFIYGAVSQARECFY